MWTTEQAIVFSVTALLCICSFAIFLKLFVIPRLKPLYERRYNRE